jgi:hypothetical protein
LPNKRPITGITIPSGITTIVGGGFHEKYYGMRQAETTFPKAPSRSIVRRSLFDLNEMYIKTRSKTTIQLGTGDDPDLDLSTLLQTMQTSQTRLIPQAIRVLNEKTTNYELKQAVDELIVGLGG